MSFPLHRGAVGAAVLLLCAAAAQAQDVAAPASTSSSSFSSNSSLRELTVTGNPLGNAETIAPTLNLSGDALLLRSQSTLGETLDREPGVSSTYFGPNASRPIIRGQDGDRIRVLQNGGASPDASALSYDHAVPVDTLVTDRIEVLRGTSALQYGGSAVGGVVNVIDNRIPSEPIEGFGGRADASYASGSRATDGGVVLEGGTDRFALHVDGFSRNADDVAVPIDLPCEKPGSPATQRRICNSASQSDGGAVGGTLFFSQGWLGASASTYRSNYGTVAEDDVTIDMHSNRYALEGEWRAPGDGFLASVHGKMSHTDYQHTEFEGPEPGTVFSNDGNDMRLEARHRPVAALGGLEGVFGLQAERTHFDAAGEEAFAPRSNTASSALFLNEELPFSWGRLSFGGRGERVTVESFGSSDPSVDRFATGERSFNPGSAAFGALVNLDANWSLTSNLGYTERAPKDYELFANGPHVATAAWEVGDASLGLEKSTGLDVGAKWESGPHTAKVNAYVNRFSNYIGLAATGNTRGEDGELNPGDPDALAEYAYTGMPARFTGIEASGVLRLAGEGGWLSPAPGQTFDLEWRADAVRAVNTDTGEPLPRIAPARVGATLAWGSGPWGARLGFDALAAQDRVPEGDRATGGYTLWNAALTYRSRMDRANLTWYARLDNIGDKLAYSATSILTTTEYPKAPLPGRSLKVGLRVTF